MVSKAALNAHKKLQAKKAAAEKKNASSSTGTTSEATDSSIRPMSDEILAEISVEAKTHAEEKFCDSKNYEFATQRLQLFPKFSLSELQLGKELGTGRFGVVTEIKGITLQKNREKQELLPECQDREFISSHCIRQASTGAARGDSARYAIKMLNRCHTSDREEFFTGAKDMAIEAHFLAAMEHPHVLKLRGLSQAPLGDKHFFLVFDRLYGTLQDRLADWKLQQHLINRGISKVITTKATKEKKRELLETRLRVMRDLSSAVMYLHHNNIIDRDLKPDNIGFDIRGDVKLFDFGLSTEFDPSQPKPYILTGLTGSLVYMAPEVHSSKPYDESCDIYALALIFWRILSLRPLFPYMTPAMLKDLVIARGARPVIDPKWSKQLRNLMGSMWDATLTKRPTAKQVNLTMRREMALLKAKRKERSGDVASDDGSNCSDKVLMTRRSTFPQRRFTSAQNMQKATEAN